MNQILWACVFLSSPSTVSLIDVYNTHSQCLHIKKNYKHSGCFPVTDKDPQEALNQISALSTILWHTEKK